MYCIVSMYVLHCKHDACMCMYWTTLVLVANEVCMLFQQQAANKPQSLPYKFQRIPWGVMHRSSKLWVARVYICGGQCIHNE